MTCTYAPLPGYQPGAEVFAREAFSENEPVYHEGDTDYMNEGDYTNEGVYTNEGDPGVDDAGLQGEERGQQEWEEEGFLANPAPPDGKGGAYHAAIVAAFIVVIVVLLIAIAYAAVALRQELLV